MCVCVVVVFFCVCFFSRSEMLMLLFFLFGLLFVCFFWEGLLCFFVLCQPFLRGRNGSTPMSTINVSVEDLANYLLHISVHIVIVTRT